MEHYGLADFFKEYMFQGLIWNKEVKDGQSPFELEVFKYEGCSRLFVGSGKDNRGLSAIVGKIEPKTNELAIVRFSQVFDSRRPIKFECELTKTPEDVFLRGKDEKNYPISLATSLKPDGLIHMGWMDKAVSVQIY